MKLLGVVAVLVVDDGVGLGLGVDLGLGVGVALGLGFGVALGLGFGFEVARGFVSAAKGS